MTDVSYRLLTPAEAPLLMEFIRRVYGDTYPSDLFADVGEISALIEARRLFSAVGFDGGQIIGHLAAYQEEAGDRTADGTTGMVLPSHRGQNVVTQLARPTLPIYRELGLVGLHLYAVTLHTITQDKSLASGAIVTGILLGDWPGDYEVAGFADREPGMRMPMVTLFLPLAFGEMPTRRVHVPERYRGMIEALYQRIEAPRTIATSHLTRSDEEAPSVSKCQVIRRTRQGVALLRFASIGRDAMDRVEQFTTEHFAAPALYLDIPLTDPRADATIDSLVDGAWYYGGLLIERQGTDQLRLQQYPIDSRCPGAQLASESRRMLDFVSADARGS